jgi:hypothetical protein
MLYTFRSHSVQKEGGLDAALKETAYTLYRRTYELARRMAEGGDITHKQMVDISSKERESLRVALGEEQYMYVMQQFQRRVFSDLNEDGESKLTSMLANYYSRGVIPYESRTTNRIRNMPDFDGKKEILRWIESGFESGITESEK